MYPYADIHPGLSQVAFDIVQFDLYRLVDPNDHQVFSCAGEAADGPQRLERGSGLCYDIWKRSEPCLNCTSRSCLAADKAMFKIEYLDGRVLLIASVPVEVEGRRLALELAKDMTESLMVADAERHDNIEITHMINRFNELAVRDAFTRLYNKTFVNNELEALARRAGDGSSARPPLIAELDVDEFKHVNDTYGHGVGDDVLLHFAQELERIAHRFDGWVGRIGGDEFLLCMPAGLDYDEVERLFCEVEAVERRVYAGADEPFSVTASCGVCFVRAGDTARSWLDRADEAMYEAKRLPGRRFVVR